MSGGYDRAALVRAAFEARERAYAPYSGFCVGAALLCADGRVFCGCNIENAAYTPSVCAERAAFFKAVSEGCREFVAIAVVGGKRGSGESEIGHCAPCGVCRQVMAEFCKPDFEIITATGTADYTVRTLADLLPEAFSPLNLV